MISKLGKGYIDFGFDPRSGNHFVRSSMVRTPACGAGNDGSTPFVRSIMWRPEIVIEIEKGSFSCQSPRLETADGFRATIF
jgi:hypothetical protein